MSWLLFLDESGHDHKHMPYEVRGGVAIHAGQLWPFVQAMQRLELDCFGGPLNLYKKELKGSTLLDRKRFRFAGQAAPMLDEARRKNCRAFLTKGLEKKTPNRDEFTAYGQACLEMARGIMQLLRDHEAVLFAAAIPRSVARPATPEAEDYLQMRARLPRWSRLRVVWDRFRSRPVHRQVSAKRKRQRRRSHPYESLLGRASTGIIGRWDTEVKRDARPLRNLPTHTPSGGFRRMNATTQPVPSATGGGFPSRKAAHRLQPRDRES